MHVGKYELIRKLATGGMAEVFLAKARGPRGFEKAVVVKRILPHLAEDPQFIDMFFSEARIAARLDHPNVVQIFDFGEVDGEYFLAMEYIDGPDLLSLARCAEQVGIPVPLHVAAKIVALACEGLAYAHELVDGETGEWLKIIHRDMSSDNILVARNGSVKVVDFGIAKAATQVHKTQTGFIKGKIAYMSREQLLNKPLDARADVYALGVVLYELVTGTHPYQADSDISLMHAIIKMPPIPASHHRPDLPQSLRRVIDKGIAKERVARYANCREMLADLEQFILEEGKPVGSSHIAQLVAEVENRLGARIGARTAPKNLAVSMRTGPPELPPDPAPAGLTQEALAATLPSVRRVSSEKTTRVAAAPMVGLELPEVELDGADVALLPEPTRTGKLRPSGGLWRRVIIGGALAGVVATCVVGAFMFQRAPLVIAKSESTPLAQHVAAAESPPTIANSPAGLPSEQSGFDAGRSAEEAQHESPDATGQPGADPAEQPVANATEEPGAKTEEQPRPDSTREQRVEATESQRAEKTRIQRSKKTQRRALKKAQQAATGRSRGNMRSPRVQPVIAPALMLKEAGLRDAGVASSETGTPVVIPSAPEQYGNLSAVQRALMQRCDRVQAGLRSLDRPMPALLEQLARVREDVPRADTKHEQNVLAASLDALENHVPERSAGTDAAPKTPAPIHCVEGMNGDCTRLHERWAHLRNLFESRNPPSRALALRRLIQIRSKIQTMSTTAEVPGITSDLDAWEREFVGAK